MMPVTCHDRLRRFLVLGTCLLFLEATKSCTEGPCAAGCPEVPVPTEGVRFEIRQLAGEPPANPYADLDIEGTVIQTGAHTQCIGAAACESISWGSLTVGAPGSPTFILVEVSGGGIWELEVTAPEVDSAFVPGDPIRVQVGKQLLENSAGRSLFVQVDVDEHAYLIAFQRDSWGDLWSAQLDGLWVSEGDTICCHSDRCGTTDFLDLLVSTGMETVRLGSSEASRLGPWWVFHGGTDVAIEVLCPTVEPVIGQMQFGAVWLPEDP